MAVLKQTSPMALPGAPKPTPSKKVPSASIRPPRENTLSALAEGAEDASVMGASNLRENRYAALAGQPELIECFQSVGIIHLFAAPSGFNFRSAARAVSPSHLPRTLKPPPPSAPPHTGEAGLWNQVIVTSGPRFWSFAHVPARPAQRRHERGDEDQGRQAPGDSAPGAGGAERPRYRGPQRNQPRTLGRRRNPFPDGQDDQAA